MKQHPLVRFLILKELSARDITIESEAVYGHETLSRSMAKKGHKRFMNGRITLETTHSREDRIEAIFMNLHGP
jgi:hypothetical protein